MESNGSGLQTAATTYWETKKDGLIAVQFGEGKFSCILNIFVMAI